MTSLVYVHPIAVRLGTLQYLWTLQHFKPPFHAAVQHLSKHLETVFPSLISPTINSPSTFHPGSLLRGILSPFSKSPNTFYLRRLLRGVLGLIALHTQDFDPSRLGFPRLRGQ